MKILNLIVQLLEVIKQFLGIFIDVAKVVPESKLPEVEEKVEEKPIEVIDKEFDHDVLREMLAFDEGKVNKIYKDSLGYYTVGIGHLLTKENNKAKAISILDSLVNRETNGQITEEEIASLFEKDLQVVINGVKSSALVEVYDAIDPIRRLALFNMVFQLGLNGTLNFKNSMRLAKENNWSKLESNLKQSLWYKQTTNRATRVINVFCDGDLKSYSKYIKA